MPAFPNRQRLLVITFMTGIVVALVLGTTMAWTAIQRFHAIESQFQELSLQDFRLTRGLRSRTNQLHSAAMRFAVTQDPVYRDRFTTFYRDLDGYLNTQLPHLEQRPLLKDLEAHLENYMAAASSMADPTAPPPADPKSAMIELLASIESVRLTLDQMGELVSELSETRVDALRRDLRDYHASVNKLQATLFASVALLVLSIVALWWLASRAFISPLKADLTQARQKAAAKEALAQIGAMAAAVVHEIRNPITTIRARTFALSGLLENHPAAQKQAHVIEEQIDRLERLSEDFLAFARPSDPRLEDVRIDTFLRDLEDILKEQAAGVRFSLGSLVDARVLMDRGQMAQVLINLVRNATEAAPAADGEVQVSAACMDRHVRISVQDNGSGISDVMLPHLFTPFKTSKQGGSGLGLCVAKNLVDNHGGELKVESHPGQGTVFHVELRRLT